LCVGRNAQVDDPAELRSLCEDAFRLAQAIRDESKESADSGDPGAQAATEVKEEDKAMESSLAAVDLGGSPTDVASSQNAYRSHLMERPGEWIRALGAALVITLLVNIPLLAISINLAVQGSLTALWVFEAVVFAIVAFFAIRSRFRGESKTIAEEA